MTQPGDVPSRGRAPGSRTLILGLTLMWVTCIAGAVAALSLAIQSGDDPVAMTFIGLPALAAAVACVVLGVAVQRGSMMARLVFVVLGYATASVTLWITLPAISTLSGAEIAGSLLFAALSAAGATLLLVAAFAAAVTDRPRPPVSRPTD